jgi:hypothetical protein
LIGFHAKSTNEIFLDLPASVAEWYSLANSVELLKQYSIGDFPMIPSDFKVYNHEDRELIIFMYDNAGILWYAFENSNDDPPVFVNVNPPPDDWRKDSKSFSEFIYTWFFDHLHYVKKDLVIEKEGKPLQANVLEGLFTEFDKEPVSYVGGPIVYRFSLNDQRIIIFNYNDVSSWIFTADTQDSLNNVYAKFKHFFQ